MPDEAPNANPHAAAPNLSNLAWQSDNLLLWGFDPKDYNQIATTWFPEQISDLAKLASQAKNLISLGFDDKAEIMEIAHGWNSLQIDDLVKLAAHAPTLISQGTTKAEIIKIAQRWTP